MNKFQFENSLVSISATAKSHDFDLFSHFVEKLGKSLEIFSWYYKTTRKIFQHFQGMGSNNTFYVHIYWNKRKKTIISDWTV